MNIIGVVETAPGSCSYILKAVSGAGCGVLGDPFDIAVPAAPSTSRNFGFTVLGAFLLAFGQYGVAFADRSGWLDELRKKVGLSKRGASRGGAAAASSEPFRAGGYGSA